MPDPLGAQAQTDQVLWRMLEGVIEGRARGVGTVLACDVEDVPDLDPVVLLCQLRAGVECLGDGCGRHAAGHERVGRDRDLGVPDVLLGEVPRWPRHQQRDVFGLRDQPADRRGTGLPGCRAASSGTVGTDAEPTR